MAEVHEGGSLCGTIRYRLTGDPLRAYVCHCTFCQRRTGSAFAVIVGFDKENVEVIGNGLTTYEHQVDGTDRMFRLHFCHQCGTTVTATIDRSPNLCLVMVGTLDDPNWVKLDRHIWTRSAQRWFVLPTNVHCFEKGGAGKILEAI